MAHADPVILSIETSGRYCSVALNRGQTLLAERSSPGEYDHSAMLVPQIREVLDEARVAVDDIMVVALSAGPGSYTGLRVGTSTAKAICYAAGIPLLAIDTLEAVARVGRETQPGADMYFPVLDARRQEVYIAAFDARGERLLPDMAIELQRSTFERLINAGEQIVICGPAAGKCRDRLDHPGVQFATFTLHGRDFGGLATERYYQSAFADRVGFTPKYVKAPNITKSVKPPF